MVQNEYLADVINVLMTEEGRKRHFSDGAPTTELGNKALEGAGVGGGIGAGAGGAIGALVGAGIPEARVKEYESGLKEGGIVMGVKSRTPEDRAYFDREWGGDRTDTVSARRGL
jgi:hypothetical protein